MRASKARERVASHMDQILKDQLANKFHQAQPDKRYEAMLDRVVKREISPHHAILELLGGGES
jgi:hypothetical protein